MKKKGTHNRQYQSITINKGNKIALQTTGILQSYLLSNSLLLITYSVIVLFLFDIIKAVIKGD
jgi:hypothetical protein